MTVVVGLDIHREQVTFDALDDVTGEVMRGRIAPADRLALRRFLGSLPAGRGRRGVGGDDGLAVHRRGVGRRRHDRPSRSSWQKNGQSR